MFKITLFVFIDGSVLSAITVFVFVSVYACFEYVHQGSINVAHVELCCYKEYSSLKQLFKMLTFSLIRGKINALTLPGIDEAG